MNRVLSGAPVPAVTGAVHAGLVRHGASGVPPHDRFAGALGDASWVPAALCAVGTVLTWWLLRVAPTRAR